MSVIIRLENLPWEARSVHIRQFFQGLQIPDGALFNCSSSVQVSFKFALIFLGGVHIVGGDRGDAFIAFNTDDDARQAMQKDGGLICQQPVKLFLSSKMEMHNVIAAARVKPPSAVNPVPNANPPAQLKRPDPLSQQFTHDIDENQHQSQQQAQQQHQQAQQQQTSVTQASADPMSSFLDVVSKMQQQKANPAASGRAAVVPAILSTTQSAGGTAATAASAAPSGLAPANLVLQLLQSNLGNLPPNLLAQVQGQLGAQGNKPNGSPFPSHTLQLSAQSSQILQQLSALQAATQQPASGSPMQTNASHSPMYNPSQTNPTLPHAISQTSLHDAAAVAAAAAAASTGNPAAFPQGIPPPLNPFLTGSLPPAALTTLLGVQQQPPQLPFPGVTNPLPANFPLPPWMQPAAAQTAVPFSVPQHPQPQRPLLTNPHMCDDGQMRSRPQHDYNQFQPNANRLAQQQQQQQQRMKLREPYLRVKNLSRKYSYRDVKLLFADYKLRLEDIKMINDQNGERTGESVVQFRSIEDAEEALSQFNNVFYGGANVQIVPATEYEFASSLDSFVPASVKKRQPEGGYCVKVTGKHFFNWSNDRLIDRLCRSTKELVQA